MLNGKRTYIWFGILAILLYGCIIYLLIVNNELKNQIFELHEKVDTIHNNLNNKIASIEEPVTYRPLIFETNEEGYAVINSVRLGFENQPEKMI